MDKQKEVVTLGAGCFWCTEAFLHNIKGVEKVEVGYANGSDKIPNPTYREICSGLTGYAEVAQITFDPSVVSLATLLDVFFHLHDPTTLNRQGADVGTQYRSAILYINEEQKAAAEAAKAKTEGSNLWDNPIVTEIVPLDSYYPAENYHQDYFKHNPSQPYCAAVIAPKVKKMHSEYSHLLKNSVGA